MFGNPFPKRYTLRQRHGSSSKRTCSRASSERKRGAKAVFRLFVLVQVKELCSGFPSCLRANGIKKQVKNLFAFSVRTVSATITEFTNNLTHRSGDCDENTERMSRKKSVKK